MTHEHRRLGDLLVGENVITPQDLGDAIEEQRRSGELLGATLVRMGLVTENQLAKALQVQLGLPLIDLDQVPADEHALALVTEELARKYMALPLEVEDRRTLRVAMADPLHVAALEDLRFHSGMFVQPVLALPSAIQESIERCYHLDASVSALIRAILAGTPADDGSGVAEAVLREGDGRPIVRLAAWLLHRAVEERATDIHVEPQDREVVVRLRVDGLLHVLQRVPKWIHGALISRLKTLANLDPVARHRPQEGRLGIEHRDRHVDMRLSTLPTGHGEKVLIRLLDTSLAEMELGDLGFLPDDLATVRRLLARPQGVLVVTGPAVSGKTTLLYAALRHLRHETRNIVTVEDPIECPLRGISQVPVDSRIRKPFPDALRAVLRQDPDVLMVGEIRDRETAEMAFRAAATGRLVLISLHTHDAPSAVTRLVDLGLEPFLVASGLIGVIGMRLVRTLCPHCKEEYEVNASNLNRMGMREVTEGTVRLSRGRGCPHCRDTGYRGRTGIFEVLEITDGVRQLVSARPPDGLLRQLAIENGMRTIGEDGLQKVLASRTTLEEVSRVVYLAETGVRMCPACREVLGQGYEYCPACGEFVGESCEHCRRRLDPRWTFCPSCGEKSPLVPAARAAVPGRMSVVSGRRKRRRRAPLERAS
ncbi:MAG TPA: ATPase, T2SS/T4P/T4SS family [Dongiaceae bacterium]|nr:ATPase, T2SS/T4P/T4SS family [Dongiaceae bacterium]